MKRSPSLCALFAAGMLVACSGGGPADAGGVDLVPISFAQWQQKLSSYPPDIVVVDFWATWCSPCIERFPKMVEMHERYRDRNVRFVSMSLEDHGDAAAIEGAERFLQRMEADFEHYLLDENLMQAFERLDLIGIPAVLIYGRDGAERFRLTGDDPNRQFTDDDVEAGIVALLHEDG